MHTNGAVVTAEGHHSDARGTACLTKIHFRIVTFTGRLEEGILVPRPSFGDTVDVMRESTDPARALLDELAAEFLRAPDVEFGTMFRSPGLRVAGKIFAFLGHDNRLIVKLPRSRAQEVVAAGTAREVTMGKRTMKEWVSFAFDDDDLDGTLSLWRDATREAHAFVSGAA